MKKNALAFITVFLLFSLPSLAADEHRQEPNRLFYEANALYEKGDYAKALEYYTKLLDMELVSGPLYYNIGNGFFKLGKTGYAILCYEKAKRLMPHDTDLESNLDYARSLVEGEPYSVGFENILADSIKRTFKNFNLNALCGTLTFFYLTVLAMLALFIAYPLVLRKLPLLFATFVLAFLTTFAAFSIRYYDEEALRHGIILAKEVECKYEPIEGSTTYYNLKEGQGVIVLNTRNGWRRIKRFDGKIAWIKKEAVEEI